MPIYDFYCEKCAATYPNVPAKYNERPDCVTCKLPLMREFPLISGHVWGCKPDGAGAVRGSNWDKARKEKKAERVGAQTNRQLESFGVKAKR